jgi:Ser/Thr protein kinase RdoA (MazF antagonist)
MSARPASLTTPRFPLVINDLKFVRELNHLEATKNYAFAVYVNSDKQEFICKFWGGTHHNQNYRWLCNEIHVYQYLAQLSQQDQRQLHAKFPTISIPHLIAFAINDTYAYLVLEKAEGKLLSKYPATVKVQAYAQVLEYFRALNQYSLPQTTQVSRRNSLTLAALFHVYLVKALRAHPEIFIPLLKAAAIFYRGLPSLISKPRMGLAHRDLGGHNNILFDGKNLSIIDFQIAAICPQIVEVANLLVSKWHDQKFITVFLESPYFQNILQNRTAKQACKAMIAYGAIFALDDPKSHQKSTILNLIETIKNL